jgi:hypothetical protein
MQSTLNPKQTDDPHDFIVLAPDAVRVAPADEELSNLLHEAARLSSKPQTPTESDFSAGPPVPPVDTRFRPADVNNVQVPGHRRSIGRSAVRGLTALLLTACIGGAAIAWQSSGNVAKQIIAKWAPKLVLTSLLPVEQSGPPAQPAPPAVEMAAAEAAPPQSASPAPTAPDGVAPTAAAAPSAESTQLLQSMARDLATVGQEVERLKASIEQLKAGQQQMSRDVAKASERSRIPAPPQRSAAATARRPMPPFPPPQAAAAPMLPQAAAPSVPRQVEPQPQATTQPQAEPELASVPRPPMPVR